LVYVVFLDCSGACGALDYSGACGALDYSGACGAFTTGMTIVFTASFVLFEALASCFSAWSGGPENSSFGALPR
jgi:hypothetical protein